MACAAGEVGSRAGGQEGFNLEAALECDVRQLQNARRWVLIPALNWSGDFPVGWRRDRQLLERRPAVPDQGDWFIRTRSPPAARLQNVATGICKPKGAYRLRRAERARIRMARRAGVCQAATAALARAIRDCRGAHLARHEPGDAVLAGHHPGPSGRPMRPYARRWQSSVSDYGS